MNRIPPILSAGRGAAGDDSPEARSASGRGSGALIPEIRLPLGGNRQSPIADRRSDLDAPGVQRSEDHARSVLL
jgi:hypothetical protein